MFLVGLTGGIAAGKSTVASLWESLGATIVDADVLAREAVAPGSAGLAAVAEVFEGVLTADGELDRKALAAFVFNDPSKRAKLEGIVHPMVVKAEIDFLRGKTPEVTNPDFDWQVSRHEPVPPAAAPAE